MVIHYICTMRMARSLQEHARYEPVPELRIVHPVGEALATNPDALEDAIAGQLVQNQWRVDDT